MFRLAIVEDDANYRAEMKAFLDQYTKDTGTVFQIREFSDGDGILQNYKSDYDLILMDIEMAFVDGMTAAEEIRKVDSEVIIIFITNVPQYAIRGYTVDALDYILKPVSYYAFSQTITRALGRREERKKKYVLISIRGGMRKIATTRIRYIEVMDHDLLFHTLDGDFGSKGSIREMEEQLHDDFFYQCNKAYLINLAFVDAVQNNDVILGKDVLQVSRSRKKGLMDALNRFMTETGR